MRWFLQKDLDTSASQTSAFLKSVCVHMYLCVRITMFSIKENILVSVNHQRQVPQPSHNQAKKINVSLLSNPRLSFTAAPRTNPRLQPPLISICLSVRLLPNLRLATSLESNRLQSTTVVSDTGDARDMSPPLLKWPVFSSCLFKLLKLSWSIVCTKKYRLWKKILLCISN